VRVLKTSYRKIRSPRQTIDGQTSLAQIEDSSFSVVFTTSGQRSKAHVLTNACPNDTIPTSSWHHLIVHTIIKGSVYRGDLDGIKVVVKLAEHDGIHQLRHEWEVYQHLENLQGQVIPICYGLYLVGDSCALLVLEDCGMPPESFSDLTVNQRSVC
jgi:hypothetical protein